VIVDSDQADHMEKMLKARYEFSMKYMAEKGWGDSFEDLSIDQILEIRDQEGWKHPEGCEDGKDISVVIE
jgi:hypothetical protein